MDGKSATDEENSCPIGPISIERFDLGMDEIKRMYALVMAENEVLSQRVEELEIDRQMSYQCSHCEDTTIEPYTQHLAPNQPNCKKCSSPDEGTERVWTVHNPNDSQGSDDIIATHVDGEKQLTVREIEQWLANLEQARYQIAAYEAAMLEARVEFGMPWEG